MITENKVIDSIFDSLPDEAKKGIERRNGNRVPRENQSQK